MSQLASLIDTLKQILRERGITYAQIAAQLSLSEASIKRSFSEQHFTLERLESICELADTSLVELVQRFDESQHRLSHLTHDQEAELVSDIKLLLVALCARNHWSFDEITNTYSLSETECIKYLARLDKIGIIELQPNNRIKLRIAEDFRWLPNGPIENFYAEKLQSEFLTNDFNQPGHYHIFLSGPVTQSTHQTMVRKLEELSREMAILQKHDLRYPVRQRYNVSLVMALRPWDFSLFKTFLRDR